MGKIRFKGHTPNVVHPYSYGIMFFGLPDTVREKIVLYLHHLQLKQIKSSQKIS
jgi:hypothetical protein